MVSRLTAFMSMLGAWVRRIDVEVQMYVMKTMFVRPEQICVIPNAMFCRLLPLARSVQEKKTNFDVF